VVIISRKGASLVFEQVIVFMIGVFIFLSCFSIFNSYEAYFSQTIIQEQLEGVSEMVVSSVVGLSASSEMNATIRISVPQFVGNEAYRINLTQSGLEITTAITGKEVFVPLSRINKSLSLGGAFSTVHGSEFMIYKRGNQIIIG
jgi:hypothetical protein